MSAPAEPGLPTDIILDTNVVLDWLVFEHPPGWRIGEQVMSGTLRWIQSPPMREELVDVLGRLLTQPDLRRWEHRHAPAMAAALAHAQSVPAPEALPFAKRLRCTDPDDQMFIDLAMARSAPWLISRDRALLKLARRAQAHGVAILTPERWQLLQPPIAPTPA